MNVMYSAIVALSRALTGRSNERRRAPSSSDVRRRVAARQRVAPVAAVGFSRTGMLAQPLLNEGHPGGTALPWFTPRPFAPSLLRDPFSAALALLLFKPRGARERCRRPSPSLFRGIPLRRARARRNGRRATWRNRSIARRAGSPFRRPIPACGSRARCP
jgi:hypothetical protein